MPVVVFSDIGKAAKGLLGGDKATGTFAFDPKVSVTSTTASGLQLTATGTQKADKIDATLKAVYSTKKYSVEGALDAANKVTLTTTLNDVAPGLKLTSSVVVPDTATAKLGLEYTMPYLALKTTLGLTPNPLVDVAASTGYQNVLLGGTLVYDTKSSALTKYEVALGYHAPDFQVSALLADRLQTLKVNYAHNLTPSTSVGAEVSRKLASADTNFALAYAKKLPSGALTKVKLDGNGLLSALYETRLSGGEKVTGSVALQATDLSKPVKYGFAVDLN